MEGCDVAVARPAGVSSRVRRGKGARHPWRAPNGAVVDLPVIVDIIERDAGDGSTIWKVEARVDLVDDQPGLLAMHLDSKRPLDPTVLQQRFRWSTPVDIVTVTMPDLIAVGIDPFRYLYPVDGYPDAAAVQRTAPTRLTDEFLTEIAHRYGRNSAELAIAWVLRQPRVTAAIVGARKPGQIKETVFGGKFAIKPEDLAKIDEALAARG